MSVSNFSPRGTGNTTDNFRRDLKDELRNMIIYPQDDNDPLFNILHSTREVMGLQSSTRPGHFDRFCQELRQKDKVSNALKRIYAISTREERPQKPEDALYPFLVDIFQAIETGFANWPDRDVISRKHFRQFVPKFDRSLSADDFVFPEKPTIRGKPDFVLAEVPAPPDGKLALDPPATDMEIWWRQCPAFLEVKAFPSELPNAHNSDVSVVKDSLAQGADYARLIMNARPFQLYVYGIFVCGDSWTVGWFDRRGVVLSPPLYFHKNNGTVDGNSFNKFVRTILRVTWELPADLLGHDPTATLLEGCAYYDPEYPRFSVAMNADDDLAPLRTWGPPLWSSHSLLGRGTSVWRALDISKDAEKPEPVIIKNSWLTEGRVAESTIYAKISRLCKENKLALPRGLVVFDRGGNVHVRHDPGAGDSNDTGEIWLSVGKILRESKWKFEAPDVGLHRVVLKDYGKPLWQCRDPQELAQGMLMAAEAHRSLFQLGVLHRDISAGNIMIRQKAEYSPGDSSSVVRPWKSEKILEGVMPQTEGFLSDFELASIRVVTDGPQPHKRPNRPITGTAIYASSELLAAIADGQMISRTYKQDVESFGWVFIYTMYRIGLNDQGYKQQKPDMYAKLNDEFTSIFSAVNIQEILDARDKAMAGTSYDEGVFPGISYLMVYVETRYELSSPNAPELALDAVTLVWVMLFRLRPKSRRRTAPWSRYRRIAEIEDPENGLKELQPITIDIRDPYGMALKPALERLLICSGGSQIHV